MKNMSMLSVEEDPDWIIAWVQLKQDSLLLESDTCQHRELG
jgi:hypothetical protein